MIGFYLSLHSFNDSRTPGFELVNRQFKLVSHESELVTHGFEVVTRGFELVTLGFDANSAKNQAQ